MDGKSPDIISDKLSKLKEIVPEAFTENKVDWERLKASLGDDINFENERYNLNWAGKSDVFRVLQQRTSATLRPVPEESYLTSPPTPLLEERGVYQNGGQAFIKNECGNVFIEGENLEVLKVLQKSYFGKIKMIYIDPPYNTGNDSFIYPDKFSESKEEYLKRIGDKSEEGYLLKEGFFRKNSKDSGHYHSNWLSMMYPRLYIARNLLRDDGVIFVSIDDNEVHNLRMIMNEIFGEENFVECITWNKRVPKNDKGIGNIHEYILIYVKNIEHDYKFIMPKEGLEEIYSFVDRLKKKDLSIAESESNLKKLYNKKGYDRGITLYNNLDKNYEIWGKINLSWPNANTIGPKYEIIHPLSKLPVKVPDRGWRWKKTTFESYLNYSNVEILHDGSLICGSIWFDKDEKTQPSLVRYLKDVDFLLLRSVISLKSDGGIEVEKIFGNKNIFAYPKPTSLIKTLIKSYSHNSDDIILDFMAGSGTTADAIIQANEEDGINRKFILVQLPEKTAADSEAFKAGYKSIADICKERIRRVINNLTPAPSPGGEGQAPIRERSVPSENESVSYRENLFKGAQPSLFEKAKQMRLVDTTEAEEKLWQVLRNRKIENCKFRRQHPLDKFIADFYCHEKKLVIEVDGGYHNEKEQKEYDELRTEIINKHGIKVIRFTNEEVLNDIESVKAKIKVELNSPPSPLLEERGRRGEVGFRVFKLVPSNFKHWRSDIIESEEDLNKMINMFDSQLKPEAQELNMLYELMLKSGYTLTDKIVQQDGFYLVADKLAVVLVKIDQRIIDEILKPASSAGKTKPQICIILDNLFSIPSGAGNDQLKTNTALQMKDAGVEMVVV